MTDPAASRRGMLRLRILCSTDLHGHLWPFDYQTDTAAPGCGLAGIATLVDAARRASPAWLLVDCGDILQGTALADRAATRTGPGIVHPMIRAMNALGYDAAALGNHDFNYGLAPLRRAIDGARFPVLCANLVSALGAEPRHDTPFVPPWCIVTRRIADAHGTLHDLRIGLVATAPPQTAIWDAEVLRGDIAARDAVATVAAHLPDMRAAGADIVVALSHAGPGCADPADMAEDTSLAIAALPGIDAVLTGHSHRRLPGPDFADLPGVDAQAGRLAGKPAAMAGAFGSDLAVMDLDLAPRPNGGWRIADSNVTLHHARETPAQAALLDLTNTDHAATRAQMTTPVGLTHTRLHAALPMAAHAPALSLLARAQITWATRTIADSGLAGLPILAAVVPFKAGGPAGPTGFVDIPAGPVTMRHMVELSPFPNRLCVLALTGADLRAWLERAVAAYGTIPPGAVDMPLLDPRAPAYSLDEIHGLRYTIDLSRPPVYDATDGATTTASGPGRIVGMWHDGRPVMDDDRFAIATNSYRANGGGGFGMVPRGTPRLFSRDTLRDILTAHVATCGEIVESGPAPWTFAPIGATAIIRTAPHVRCATHGDGQTRMEDAGTDPDGYHRIRLFL